MPHREKYLKLGLEFVDGLISLYEELIQEVERDFAKEATDQAKRR